MFKNLTVFQIVNAATRKMLGVKSLQAAIPEPTIVDPGKTEWARIGFAHPDNFGSETVFVGADNTRLFDVQIRERMLPGKVIKKHLDERCAELADRQGRKLSKKERMGVKDEVVASLLPTAFIRPTDILCMVTKDYLIIGTSSAKHVDACLLLIGGAVNSALNLRPINAKRDVGAWMFDLLDAGTTEGGVFDCGASVALKNGIQRATFKEIDLTRNAVRDAVESGMRPVEIAATYDEHTNFAITDKLVIKRLHFSDILMNDAETDPEDESGVSLLDGTVAIVSGTLTSLLNDLMSEIAVMADEDEGEDEEDEL